MKKTFSKALSLILAAILAFGATIPAFASDEIPEGYTPIYTAEDLNNIRNNLSGSYILMNDIDLSVYDNWGPIRTFKGIFDGNGFLIKGLKINMEGSESGETYCGLFGRLYEATLKNVKIYDADIFVKCPEENYAYGYAGILAGMNYDGSVSDCAVSGKIRTENFSWTYTGGVVGLNVSGGTSLCTNYADVSAYANSSACEISVGGVLGNSRSLDRTLANYGNICVTGKDIDEKGPIYISVGGVIGNSIYSHGLLDSFNSGNVITDISTPLVAIGGITGISSAIYRSYNCGTVTVPDEFIGWAGAVCGNVAYADGLGTLTTRAENLYYLMTDMIASYVNDLHPDDASEDLYNDIFFNVQELGEKKMKSQSCFAGFDFDTVWVMEEGGYPVLQNQPTLTVKESIELEKGEIYVPKSFESWKSNDETVATVNENGEIVALSAGTATVTIEHAYGFYTEYTVTVTDLTVTPEPEPTPDPEPPTEPNEPTDPEPTCWLLKIINLIKKVWIFVVNTVKSFF